MICILNIIINKTHVSQWWPNSRNWSCLPVVYFAAADEAHVEETSLSARLTDRCRSSTSDSESVKVSSDSRLKLSECFMSKKCTSTKNCSRRIRSAVRAIRDGLSRASPALPVWRGSNLSASARAAGFLTIKHPLALSPEPSTESAKIAS